MREIGVAQKTQWNTEEKKNQINTPQRSYDTDADEADDEDEETVGGGDPRYPHWGGESHEEE